MILLLSVNSQFGVCHTVALPFTLRRNLKAKEESQKLQYFTMQKLYLQKKNPLKETQDPSTYYNSRTTNLKFQHKPKYHLSKIH
jgi:hypothetical protein